MGAASSRRSPKTILTTEVFETGESLSVLGSLSPLNSNPIFIFVINVFGHELDNLYDTGKCRKS